MFMLAVEASKFYTCGNLDISVGGVLINLVHILYMAILVGVPVLLIFFGMLDLGKAVIAQKEDEIKKGQQLFVKRLITAALVFLVFVIVTTVLNVFTSDKGIMNCVRCFINDDTACKVVE